MSGNGAAGTLAEEHARIAAVVSASDDSYHSGDEPTLSDAEYDPLRRRLKEIEAAAPELAEGSPTAAVGARPRGGFAKVAHAVRMISLDNAFTAEDVAAFVARVAKAVGEASPRFVAEPKIDGLSLGVRYSGGVRVLAATRGDSSVGEDVTPNAALIVDLPETIPYAGDVEVRGEAYMSKADLADLNARQAAAGEKTFANCRNAAAGALRNLDAAKAAGRKLRFFGYSMVGAPEAVTTQEQLLETLHGWGFSVSEWVGVCEGADELVAYHADVARERASIGYDLDGVVYKLDDMSARLDMGDTSRTPRWAIAHKFEAEKAVTRLNGISVQVGRTGVITPVAVLEPIRVGGVTVSSATLHNEDEIARKDVRVGDMVTVQRAGDVIPQVLGHVPGTRAPDAPAFVFPKACPSCGSEIVRAGGEVAARCRAAFSCPDQRVERLRHMASRDVLDVEGLGEGAVEALVEAGILHRPGDVFRIPARKAEVAALAGFGERSAGLLADAATGRRGATLDRYLAALGVRHMGGSKAKLVAALAVTADGFLAQAAALAAGDAETTAAYVSADNVGPALVEAIKEHFGQPSNVDDAHDLASVMDVPAWTVGSGPLKGRTVVFTGSLERMGRAEAKSGAEALGAKVSGSVSKKTWLVVAGPGAGTKLDDATKHGVEVVDEEEWLRRLDLWRTGGDA